MISSGRQGLGYGTNILSFRTYALPNVLLQISVFIFNRHTAHPGSVGGVTNRTSWVLQWRYLVLLCESPVPCLLCDLPKTKFRQSWHATHGQNAMLSSNVYKLEYILSFSRSPEAAWAWRNLNNDLTEVQAYSYYLYPSTPPSLHFSSANWVALHLNQISWGIVIHDASVVCGDVMTSRTAFAGRWRTRHFVVILLMLRSIINKCYSTSLPVTQGRYFHRRPVHFAVNPSASSSVSDAVKAEVKAENEDISTMDRCMKIIRKQIWVSSIRCHVDHRRGKGWSCIPQVRIEPFRLGSIHWGFCIRCSVIPSRIPTLWAEALATSTLGADLSVDLNTTTTVDLTPRNMHDSYSELVLPFGSSKDFFEQYTNAWGGIRTGKYVLRISSAYDQFSTWMFSQQNHGTSRFSSRFYRLQAYARSCTECRKP